MECLRTLDITTTDILLFLKKLSKNSKFLFYLIVIYKYRGVYQYVFIKIDIALEEVQKLW